MHGVMRHVEKERLAFCDRLIHRPSGLDRKCFREEDVLPVVLFQVGHIPHSIPLSPSCTEVLGSQKAAGATRGMSGAVNLESDVSGIASRRSDRSEVRFPDMNRAVAGFT
jgi:hypothetical protein